MDRLPLLLIAIFVMEGAMAKPSCSDTPASPRYVRELNIKTSSFGDTKICDLVHSLQLIEDGEFIDSESSPFVRDFVDGELYYVWLREHIRSLESGNDLPETTASNSAGHITLQKHWHRLSSLARAGSLIHEARHTEGHSHTTCESGPYKDSPILGCDENFDQGGAHAVETEYYARVAEQGRNFHPAFKAMAKLMLRQRSQTVFNQDPLAEREQLLVRTTEGWMRVDTNGKEVLSWDFTDSASLQLKTTSLGPALFDLPLGAWLIRLQPFAVPLDGNSFFKRLNLAPPSGMVDAEEFETGLRRYLYAADDQNHLFAYNFGQSTWTSGGHHHGLKRLVTINPLGQTGLFIVFDNDTYCPIRASDLTCDRSPSSWPTGSKRFVHYQNSLLRLDENGKVYDSQGRIWNDLANETVLDLIVIPNYEVQE